MGRNPKRNRRTAALCALAAVVSVSICAAAARGQCEVAKLTASGEQLSLRLGYDVAADGEWIAVSSVAHTYHDNDNAGAVYLYRVVPGGWRDMREVQRLDPPAGLGPIGFGRSLALHGTTLVVGAGGDFYGPHKGFAFVYEWDGSLWNRVATLRSDFGRASNGFGDAIATDGEVVVVGAYRDRASPHHYGAALVYHRPAGGWTDMTPSQRLVAPDGASAAEFGASVILHDNQIFVGAPATDGAHARTGMVYVFERAADQWHAIQTIEPGSATSWGEFGKRMSISGNVLTSTLGSYAIVHEHDGNEWAFKQSLFTGQSYWYTGYPTDICAEGDTIVVGYPLAEEGFDEVGRAYVFQRDESGSWALASSLRQTNASEEAKFGNAVTILDGLVVATAPGDDQDCDTCQGRGSASIQQLSGACPPAANDSCDGALPLQAGRQPFHNLHATASGLEEPCGEFNADVWFQFEANAPGRLVVCLSRTDFAGSVALYGACPKGSMRALGCVSGVAADGNVISIDTEPAEYFIRVGSTDGSVGHGELVARVFDGAIRVPADLPTMHDAIEVALSGDEIIIAPGSYVGGFGFAQKNLVVRGETGIPGDVAINGGSPVLWLGSGVTSQTRIEGVTISGGQGYWYDSSPGGVYIAQASPQFRNCYIRRNLGPFGGGVYCRLNASPTFYNCAFSGNRAQFDYQNYCSTNYPEARGGAMYVDGGYPILRSCTIAHNSADCDGGGVYVASGSVTAYNTIFAYNFDYENGTSDLRLRQSGTNLPWADLAYCLISGGWDGEGNLDGSPKFFFGNDIGYIEEPPSDLRLRSHSPGIDAGNNDFVNAFITTDLRGEARRLDEPLTKDTGVGSGGPVVDIGAFEYYEDCDGNGVIDSIDLAKGVVGDCNDNFVPDACEVQDYLGVLWWMTDCNYNLVPDECEMDEPGANCNGDWDFDQCYGPCEADLYPPPYGDCVVDGGDVAHIIGAFGMLCPDGCSEDLASTGISDGVVSIADVLEAIHSVGEDCIEDW